MIVNKPGDLVLITFPFTSGAGAKLRPALVILDTGDDDLLVERVTSQAASSPFDVIINEWRGAGLLAPSTARLHKMATLTKSDVRRTLGHLQVSDWQDIATALRQVFGSWWADSPA